MLIKLDLNTNDSELLLRHCAGYQPNSGDFREDSRLGEALEALASAINDAMQTKHAGVEAMEMIDPRLLEAAISLFGDQTLAIGWLSKTTRSLGDKRPIDVDVEIAIEMIARLEHGICP